MEVALKFISGVLIGSLILSSGCYSDQTITHGELTATPKENYSTLAGQRDLIVFTKDSSRYEFSKENYLIQSDTLTGFGIQARDGKEMRFHGTLSFSEITSLQTSEFSTGKTIAGTVLLVALVIGVGLALSTVRVP
jgi:hypothetical protein